MQRLIDFGAIPLLPFSGMMIWLAYNPGMVICGPGAEAIHMHSRLMTLAWAVPGLLLGMLSAKGWERFLARAGWLLILLFCWSVLQRQDA